jgi:hypothetical protein
MNSPKFKLASKSDPSFLLMLLLVLDLLSGVNLYAQDKQADQKPQNPSANQQAKPPSPQNVTLRAPDVMPGTLPEMRDPSYWIGMMTNPDAVILSPMEIQNRNNASIKILENFSQVDGSIRKQITAELSTRPGLLTSIPDVTTKTPAEVSALVSGWIDTEIQFLTKRRASNILGIQYADWEIKNISDEMASAKNSNQINIQTAITVKNCRLRIIPAIRPEYTSGTGWDMWNFDILPISSPVKILSASKTGGFLFVLTDRGYGWINSEDVAIASKEQIDNFCKTRDFIMCTGERVPFFTDSTCSYVYGWFRMGDHLGDRDSYNSRSVIVPTRMINGRVSFQEAWLKPDADVSRGYLPYTRKNIVLQAFKLLDNIYDWSGGWYGRDHATQLRDIFSTFGFKFPSMGGLLSAYQPIAKVIYPKDGYESQIKAILANDPFTTIQICATGHAQLFLGNYNGVPILFDTHGYRYSDNDGKEYIVRRANVGTQAFPDYFLKREAVWFLELK